VQQEWDDLEKIIINSTPDMHIDERYNYRLMTKLNDKKQVKGTRYAAGLSLIMAGLMLALMYTPSVEYKIIDMKYKVKTEISMLKLNHSFDKYFLGE
jgi:hypothetical protein